MEDEGSQGEELRQRRKAPSSELENGEQNKKTKGDRTAGKSAKCVALQRFAKLFVGCLVTVTSGMMYAVYLSTYHERKFWFSSRRTTSLILFTLALAILVGFYASQSMSEGISPLPAITAAGILVTPAAIRVTHDWSPTSFLL